jgi:Lrp/AsnC family leucine-responsive transcriptional regulator
MAVEITMVDVLDSEIIRILQGEGRLSFREVGERVGLSPNATGVRVSKLIEDGVITGIHAHVDHAKLGRPLEAFVDCWLDDRDPLAWDRVVDHIMSDDRIIDAVHLTGKVDYRLRVVVASPQELDEILGSLRIEAGIGETDTRLVLRNYRSV